MCYLLFVKLRSDQVRVIELRNIIKRAFLCGGFTLFILDGPCVVYYVIHYLVHAIGVSLANACGRSLALNRRHIKRVDLCLDFVEFLLRSLAPRILSQKSRQIDSLRSWLRLGRGGLW